jgi:hypothetical protein
MNDRQLRNLAFIAAVIACLGAVGALIFAIVSRGSGIGVGAGMTIVLGYLVTLSRR